jgi:DNA-binding GntR family transcriptional regulator
MQPVSSSDLNLRSTITERIASLIRHRVLDGTLRAGTPLREEDLSRELEVSRHVIREALRLLAADGLADYSSFKGARVTRVAPAAVSEIYAARQFIEQAALTGARKAPDANRLALIHGRFGSAVAEGAWTEAFDLDIEFHAFIVELAGSARLSAWHRSLFQGLRLAHLLAPPFQEEGLSASVPQHAEIALALTAGDLPRARVSLERHLAHAEKHLMLRMQ